jgi:osmotically-inducible protein OsmY
MHSEAQRQRAVAIAAATAGIVKVQDRIRVLNYRANPREH